MLHLHFHRQKIASLTISSKFSDLPVEAGVGKGASEDALKASSHFLIKGR